MFYIFSNCSIRRFTFGSSVTTIGDAAIPASVEIWCVSVSDMSEFCNNKVIGLVSNLKPEYGSFINLVDEEGHVIRDYIIPDGVISIGNNAFSKCFLNSVTIPNSVISIGDNAFFRCRNLASLAIPNSVTSIGNDVFYGCTGLTSMTIPNSVTSIGDGAFGSCTGLTSITIGSSVTSIGKNAFDGCSGLTSVHISDVASWCNIRFDRKESNPLFYAQHLYINGKEESDLIIPNNVTSINSVAFYNYSGLNSVTIPNSVTSIGGSAFAGCTSIQYVKTYITEPYSISKNVFPDEVYRQSTLYIPAGTEKLYTRFDGWREFLKIVEMDESDTPYTPGADKCKTPTISYKNGKLAFECDTEGATFVTDITDADIKKHYDATISLTATYTISVYATKEGYNNSDVVTATLCWIDTEPQTEGITNVAQIRARAVMIQSNGNVLSVSGADEGKEIFVYDTAGKKVGSSVATSDVTNITTSLDSGSIAIIKIGEKAVKVLIE